MSAAVLRAVQDVPSNISGATMDEWVELSRIQLNNYLGTSIPSGGAISEAHQPLVFHYVCAYTLASMQGVGIDYDVSLGDFSVNGGGDSREFKQLKFHLDQVNADLKSLGRATRWKQTFY